MLPQWEHDILAAVRIIARRALREFWERHPDAEQPLRAWYHDVRKADWRSPADVKRVANKYLTKGRVVLSVVPIGAADQASKPSESKKVTADAMPRAEVQR